MTEDKAMVTFNAMQHGVLSRDTVLPWEDADDYGAVLEALAVAFLATVMLGRSNAPPTL